MPELFWDLETRSAASLRMCGAWRYASDDTTDVLCCCFAVDAGAVESWRPGQPPPAPFLAAAADPLGWRTIAHNFEFELAILEHVLTPRYDFPPLPLEVQHCSMALALANAYPAELDLLAQALELEYQKDREGVRLMRLMSQPRKPRKGEDRNVLYWVFDEEKLQRLIAYCTRDVLTTRAVWRHPQLKPLNDSERRIQILDAHINARGVRADRELATAARDLALRELSRLNIAVSDLTEGAIETINQVERIRAAVNAHGHRMETLNKRSVAAVLAHEPSDHVRQLLELRRDGARASTRKYERILSSMSENDDRIRGSMRLYGAGPGRWAGRGPQLQNLKKNESGIPLAAIEAVRSGDRDRLREFGKPLTVLGDIARAVICAGPGNMLVAADFAAIESRVLSWLAGEEWKLEAYREYDRTGDKAIEPYRIVAAQMLHKPAREINSAERQQGKAGDLACGFGGSVRAWKRIAAKDNRPDAEILADVHAWRRAHPKTTIFWRELARAIRVAIRTGQPTAAGRIVAEFTDRNLYLTLPSRRRITYPGAQLVASKFEGGYPDVQFKDNAHGKWSDYRGWFGTFVENVVQGIARDLLAAAIERFETRGIAVALHIHDEAIAEVAAGSITEAEFLATMLEPPAWAEGLPLAGTAWSGTHYFEPSEEPAPAPDTAAEEAAEEVQLDALIDAVPDPDPENPAPDLEVEISDDAPPLFDLVSVPLTADHKTTCPFHPGDTTPSLQFYDDHFHCFGCEAHGDRIDWLTSAEGMSHQEAVAHVLNYEGGPARPQLAAAVEDKAAKRARALALWGEGIPIADTLAAHYLAKTRGIAPEALPAAIDTVLRFHANCPFGGARHPCLLALLRNPMTDEPTGVHRIALTPDGRKIERRMFGQTGAVKLWPAGTQLVVGEGIETVLAAATRIPYRGAPLRPAWALVSSGFLGQLPVLSGVERLIILVDHDDGGITAASACVARWTRAGRIVVRLTPKRPGADFNDIILQDSMS